MHCWREGRCAELAADALSHTPPIRSLEISPCTDVSLQARLCRRCWRWPYLWACRGACRGRCALRRRSRLPGLPTGMRGLSHRLSARLAASRIMAATDEQSASPLRHRCLARCLDLQGDIDLADPECGYASRAGHAARRPHHTLHVVCPPARRGVCGHLEARVDPQRIQLLGVSQPGPPRRFQ